MASVRLSSSWTALDVTTGTIQNVGGSYSIEVSEDNTAGTGQELKPGEAMSFSGVQLYARAVVFDDTEIEARVNPFVEAGVGGSGGSGGGGSVTPYTLPTASAGVKGGVKVGSGLKMTGDVLSADTGTASGKLLAVGADGKIDSSVLPAIAIGNTFVETSEAGMLALAATVGDICVRNDEHKSYILQTAPASTLANWILLETPASDVTSVNGQTGAVTVTVPTKVSDLTNDSGYIASVPTATTTSKGIVSVGDGLSIDGNGKLSVTGGGGGGGSYTLPTATATELGGIKVGANLEITDSILKAKHETITMGTDTTSTATVASGGTFTAIDSITKDTHGHVTAVNTKTVTVPTLPGQADGTTAGIAKLYTATGENTDGAMTQKAVKDALGTKLDASDYKLTDLIDDTTASTSTVYSASKIDTKLGGYLPLSGGVMTVRDIISRNVDDSAVQIMSATSYEKGAYIRLNGQDSDHNAGVFSLTARDATNGYKQLTGMPDGTLTWGSNNVLTSDGILVGSAAIKRASDTGYLELYGASGYKKGAMISLSGKDRTGLAGEFYIRADNGTTSKELKGKPDGTLAWEGKDISNTYSTTEKAIGTWIDGKTIYRRVYTFSEVTLAPDEWKQLTQVSSTGITQVVSAWVFRAADNNSIPIACNVAGQYIGVYSFGSFNVTKLCLEYTKS